MTQGKTTDVFTPEQRSAVMRKVPGKNSSAEMAVRRLLTGMGLRYRLHRKDLPGNPDVVMAGRRLALFVHGCFWHGHDCRRGARAPKANAEYWTAKIARNRARDTASSAALQHMGWRPVTIWECELKDSAKLEARLRALLNVSAD
ncbi:MAG TPA: very short patch repair endonuclease [Caulobacteraceae bacterium]|jgi:DNA mismatch endonuclease (patch repair protein)|nr:very short patch repair endonuclease [Caulobacteraceae bacterium]